MINTIADNVEGLIAFYRMNWYGFPIGHYMAWLGLGEVSLLSLKVYVEKRKSKNDIRRFQVDGHRK
jgi:hypothetical protein